MHLLLCEAGGSFPYWCRVGLSTEIDSGARQLRSIGSHPRNVRRRLGCDVQLPNSEPSLCPRICIRNYACRDVEELLESRNQRIESAFDAHLARLRPAQDYRYTCTRAVQALHPLTMAKRLPLITIAFGAYYSDFLDVENAVPKKTLSSRLQTTNGKGGTRIDRQTGGMRWRRW